MARNYSCHLSMRVSLRSQAEALASGVKRAIMKSLSARHRQWTLVAPEINIECVWAYTREKRGQIRIGARGNCYIMSKKLAKIAASALSSYVSIFIGSRPHRRGIKSAAGISYSQRRSTICISRRAKPPRRKCLESERNAGIWPASKMQFPNQEPCVCELKRSILRGMTTCCWRRKSRARLLCKTYFNKHQSMKIEAR